MKKRKDGRYQKKVTLSDGRQKLVYGRTIAEATQAADALRDEDRQGIIVGDNTTVEEWAQTFCALCLYCGLRREEALGLQWTDTEAGQLTVNRSITFLGNQPDSNQELKTKASHRTIPMPRALQTILEDTPRLGIYVITRTDGSPMTQIGFKRMWDKVKRAVPFEVRPHMLRHSYATNLYRAGIDLKTAQYLLGHETIQMTANIYTHMEKEDAMRSVDKLDQYFSRDGENQKVVKK